MTEVPFNPNAKDGRGIRGLSIPKSNWANTIEQPPFEAYGVTCGLTFTFGGLKIDTSARVIDTDGVPIPGLFAAGELVGGIFYFNYPSGTGLMNGAVFGRIFVARRLGSDPRRSAEAQSHARPITSLSRLTARRHKWIGLNAFLIVLLKTCFQPPESSSAAVSKGTRKLAPSPLTSRTLGVRNRSLRARSVRAIVTAFDSASAFASTDREPATRRTGYALPCSSFHLLDSRKSRSPSLSSNECDTKLGRGTVHRATVELVTFVRRSNSP